MSDIGKVFDVTRELILELKDIDESEFNLDTRIDVLELDSLDFVELQVVMKKHFAVALDAQAFASGKVSTLRDMCELVVRSATNATTPA
jgi:acyl carrier protein